MEPLIQSDMNGKWQQKFAHELVSDSMLTIWNLSYVKLLQLGPTLLATNQTEFNMDALPTHHGQPWGMHDMAEIYVCICGNVVEVEVRVMESNIAVYWAFNGCETSWVC